jgi:hypothetical protein
MSYGYELIPHHALIAGVEVWIVNAPLVSRRVKTQTMQKVRLDLNS